MRKIWSAFVMFSLVLLITLTPSVLGLAQNPTVTETIQQQSATNNKIDGFPVVIDGETLFLIKRGVGSFSAEERAIAIRDRIIKIAQDDSIPVDNLIVKTDTEDNLYYLSANNQVILSVTPQDAQAYDSNAEQLAKNTLQKVQAAITQYRKARQPAQLFRSTIVSIIATFALLITIFLIIRTSSKILPSVRNWIDVQLPGIRIQNFEIVSSYQISKLCLRIMQLIRLIFILFVFYTYLTFVLSLFPWTEAFGERILNYVIDALELVFGRIIEYLPNIFIIAVIIFLTYYTIRFIKPFFTAIERRNLVIPGFYPDWAQPTYNIILVLIIAIGAIVAFPYLPGFNSPAFQGISVFLGLLFSLGSTSAIANVVGGIILIYTRSFQIGDRIQIGDVVGDVIEKTLLVVRICTPTNKIITIPNSFLLNTNVVNFSVSSRELNRPLIIQTTVTLGYDLPWRKVHETLIKAALETPHILKQPDPFVFQTSLDDFYVSYQLNAYTDKPNLIMLIYSELHQNIQDYCNEVGIEIMSPHYSTLRDGNQSTIPENYLPDDYVAPPFRVQSSNNGETKS